MARRSVPSVWAHSKMARTTEDMQDGGGCHLDEAQAVSDYFRGSLSCNETSKRITAAILDEKNPPEELYRLWSLLSEAMVELWEKERDETIDLLVQIQALPPSHGVQWADLPGFTSMWDNLYRLHLHGSCGAGMFDKDNESKLRKEYEAVGRAEAKMLLRGIVVDENWGYRILNLVCSDRPELEVLIYEVFGWLDVAGWKLREKAISEKTTKVRFHGLGSHPNKQRVAVEETLEEHWVAWRAGLVRISRGETGLSEEAKRIAARCLELM
jgi:hypothetical protein